MDYYGLIRKLHYPDKLYDIVEKYAAVEGKRLDKLLDFIEGVPDDQLDDMASGLQEVLKKRIKNNSVNERIYADDLGLYYDRQAHGYKFKESWMGGRKKRRKRGGVPLGHRCGTNEDCDEGLQCELQALLSGPQVDNNQRGVCKGGRRRRRKRTRKRKKSKRRKRKKTRTKKKRRRRRRK